MGVFHVFKTVQMAPNGATHHMYLLIYFILTHSALQGFAKLTQNNKKHNLKWS